MKKIIVLLMLCIGLFSCSQRPPTLNGTPIGQTIPSASVIDKRELEIYNVNGHQYIGSLYGSNDDVFTHSGECTHPLHKMIRDTVYIHDTVYVEMKSKKILR